MRIAGRIFNIIVGGALIYFGIEIIKYFFEVGPALLGLAIGPTVILGGGFLALLSLGILLAKGNEHMDWSEIKDDTPTKKSTTSSSSTYTEKPVTRMTHYRNIEDRHKK